MESVASTGLELGPLGVRALRVDLSKVPLVEGGDCGALCLLEFLEFNGLCSLPHAAEMGGVMCWDSKDSLKVTLFVVFLKPLGGV